MRWAPCTERMSCVGDGDPGHHRATRASGIAGTDPYYFVELNENFGAKNVAITSYW